MRIARRPAPRLDEQDHRLARRELARLDAWSFWTVPLARGHGAHYVVVGTTGAFAIALCGLEGYAEVRGRGLRVGEASLRGFREVQAAARAERRRLHHASVPAEVEAVICLTRARAGRSRELRGVAVVRLEDLAEHIAKRERRLDPATARHGAEALGRPIDRGEGARPDIEEPPGP